MSTPIRAQVAAIVEQLDAVASLHPATSHLLRHLATDGPAALRGDEVPRAVVSAALARWYAAGMPDVDRPGSDDADGPEAPGIRGALALADAAIDRTLDEISRIQSWQIEVDRSTNWLYDAKGHIEAARLALAGPVPSPEEAP